MDNRTTTILTLLVLVAMGFLLLFNLTSIFNEHPYEKYLAYNDVRGSAAQHEGKLYTLNFDQQNLLVESINRSIPILREIPAGQNLPIDKIVIYRFQKPDLVITPVAYYNDNLVFSVPELFPKGNLQDISIGDLRTLLSQTYDH
jgi:hypothetical protein